MLILNEMYFSRKSAYKLTSIKEQFLLFLNVHCKFTFKRITDLALRNMHAGLYFVLQVFFFPSAKHHAQNDTRLTVYDTIADYRCKWTQQLFSIRKFVNE
jgi:hypothetical protein